MSSVKKLKHALTYADLLNKNLETHPIPELPKENEYAKYAKYLALQEVASKTRHQTNEVLSREPNPPTNTKTSETNPKTKFVKNGGKRANKMHSIKPRFKRQKSNTTKTKKTKTKKRNSKLR